MYLISIFFEIILIEFINLVGKINPKIKNWALNKIKIYKLRKICKYAYFNSSFYRKFYNDHGIFENDLSTITFEKIPVISKKEIIENINEVYTVKDLNKDEIFKYIYDEKSPELYKNNYICYATSGSLGTKFPVSNSLIDFRKIIFTSFIYGSKSFKFLFGKKIKIALIGLINGRGAGISIFRNCPQSIYNRKEISILDSVDNIIEQLNNFMPEQIISYPGIFVSLISHKKNGKLKINPKLIILSGEVLSDENTKLILEIFKCKLINSYNASECFNMGLKRNEKPYMIFPNLCHIEILDNDNKPASAGKLGRVIVTNFINRTQPFIRYDIGDCALNYINEKGEQIFNGVEGRSYKPLEFKNNSGDKIEIAYLSFYGITIFTSGIIKAQMHIGHNCFKTLLVGDDEGIQKCKESFEDYLKKLNIDQTVKFKIEKVNDIQPELNGKIPFIKYENSLIIY
ncbi:hypothetical protein [Silvanigrella aquatica]|uniref:AMP-dependent synthetase/ligase domain-containing protein n=1 Tax=Silvanigrella aquatica TaxID=1915309 RepID=A0A1L4D277_9BACT|nr:hypothetical protein [Silvanigrella aquatica]APJ04297.1 hypothetical protein AXG55_10420 [Silvanigrella aquatica]